jgi:hypothetical protein
MNRMSIVLATCIIAALPAAAQQSTGQLAQFLRQGIGLDEAQLATIERGEPVVRVLETQNRRDVAVFGVITLRDSHESYVRRLRDFRSSLAAPTRVRFGIFSTPAASADVATLTIERDDLEDAKKCRPGDCKFKLPATEMRRIKEQLSGSSAEQLAKVNAYARTRLAEYVNDYRALGDSALVVYDDRGGVSASDAFRTLLAESPYVFQYVPALANYLTTYPANKLDGATDIVYWAEDQPPHLRRTLTATHLVMYTPPEFPDMTVVAAKQIYAKHFFEAGLELTSVIARDGQPGSYLLVLRRYRFDNLPSGGLLNIRGRVINSLRDKLLADLKRDRG